MTTPEQAQIKRDETIAEFFLELTKFLVICREAVQEEFDARALRREPVRDAPPRPPMR